MLLSKSIGTFEGIKPPNCVWRHKASTFWYSILYPIILLVMWTRNESDVVCAVHWLLVLVEVPLLGMKVTITITRLAPACAGWPTWCCRFVFIWHFRLCLVGNTNIFGYKQISGIIIKLCWGFSTEIIGSFYGLFSSSKSIYFHTSDFWGPSSDVILDGPWFIYLLWQPELLGIILLLMMMVMMTSTPDMTIILPSNSTKTVWLGAVWFCSHLSDTNTVSDVWHWSVLELYISFITDH